MASYVPIGRIRKPEDVVEVVMYLCSEKISYVTGPALAVDRGML